MQALDGTEAYTRAGALDIDAEGQLVTRSGLPVLGDGGPITVPANAAVEIARRRHHHRQGRQGALAGAGPAQAGHARDAADPRRRRPVPRRPAATCEADAAARVQQGALEGSNVSAVETMVAMIAAARQFEQQMKMLQTAEQKEQAATRLLSNSTV